MSVKSAATTHDAADEARERARLYTAPPSRWLYVAAEFADDEYMWAAAEDILSRAGDIGIARFDVGRADDADGRLAASSIATHFFAHTGFFQVLCARTTTAPIIVCQISVA
jgi:hypothetical protein